MKRNIQLFPIKTILLFLLISSVHSYAQSKQNPPEVITLDSKVLGEKRNIRIQLPSSMNPFDSYPVMYLLDGEVFTPMVSGQVQYLSEAYKIIPNLIIVGIENTDRMRDLTPTHTDKGPDGKVDTSARSPFHNTGGGEKFLEFIKSEVKPLVESKYKTTPFSILAGHSLGGLMAIYCLVEHPEMFNAYIAISPSLQWDDQSLLRSVTRKLNNKMENKLLFFSDANEDAAFHKNQLTLDSILQRNNARFKFKRLFYPDETHISEPVKGFYDAIRFIYPAWHLPYNSTAFRKTLNYKIIRDHYQQLSNDYHYEIYPLHDEVIAIARFLRNDPARIPDAIELLKTNMAHYPSSPVLLETLADTYLKIADTTNAKEILTKALKLDPTNNSLSKKINSLNQ